MRKGILCEPGIGLFADLERDFRIAMSSEPLSKETAIHALSGIRHLLAIIPLGSKSEQCAVVPVSRVTDTRHARARRIGHLIDGRLCDSHFQEPGGAFARLFAFSNPEELGRSVEMKKSAT